MYTLAQDLDVNGNKITNLSTSISDETAAIPLTALTKPVGLFKINSRLLDIVTKGKNLFNPDKIIAGKFVNSANGLLATGTSYNASAFIDIEPTIDYAASSNIAHYAYYDADGVYISGGTATTALTIPAGAYLIRFSIHNSYDINTFQFEQSTTPTTFEAFTNILNNVKLEDDNVITSNIEDAAITEDKLNIVYKRKTYGALKNKFDKDVVNLGRVVLNGNLSVNSGYNTTNYLEITPNNDYISNTLFGHRAYYDKDKGYISQETSGATIFTSPSEAYFARISFSTAYSINDIQIEQGDILSTYESYKEGLLVSYLFDKTIKTDNILDSSVTADKISIILRGKNIFDKTAITASHYVNYLSGVLVASVSYNASDYLKVSELTQYICNELIYYKAYYNEYKIFISGENTNVDTFTTPSNAAYVRLTISTAKDLDTLQIEQGATTTTYEVFKHYIAPHYVTEESIADNAITTDGIKFGAVTEDKIDLTYSEKIYGIGKNKFNKTAITTGYFVNYLNGNLSANAAYNASDYLAIKPSTNYVSDQIFTHHSYYDEDKVFISGTNVAASSFTSPSGAYYIRGSLSLARDLDTFQFEEGTVSTSYEPYINGLKLQDEQVTLAKLSQSVQTLLGSDNEISMPAKQYLLDLYQNSIYFQAIIKRWTPTQHIPKIEGGEWYSMETLARVDLPTTETSGVDVKIYDLDFNAIALGSFDVVIGNQATGIGVPLTVISIGDSLTYDGRYLTKANVLCPDLVFDGMRNSAVFTGLAEGRGGWTLDSYFTKMYNVSPSVVSFTPFMHPVAPYIYYGSTGFWKAVLTTTGYDVNGFTNIAASIGFNSSDGYLTSPSTNDVMYDYDNDEYKKWDGSSWVAISAATLNFSFNFAKYRSTWGIAQPNVVTVMLGTNDFRSAASDDAIDTLFITWAAQMEELIASVIADNATTKIAILIAPSVNGKLNNHDDAFIQKLNARMWYARKLVIDEFDEREAENIYLVDVGSSLDPDYGFLPYSNEVPFSDYTGTESRPTVYNTPHPSGDGYYQMGVRLSGFLQKIR